VNLEEEKENHKDTKSTKAWTLLPIFVAASEEEIKKMDRIVGSTERVFYPSF
jgi:hypothetical protein